MDLTLILHNFLSLFSNNIKFQNACSFAILILEVVAFVLHLRLQIFQRDDYCFQF